MVSHCWLACIGVVFVVEGIVGSVLEPCPRNRGLSDGLTRAVNTIRQRALYRIDLRNAQKGYRPGKVYNFRVQTTYRKSKFNDATVVLEQFDQRCDVGSFVVADDSRYSPKGCPNVVTTQEKQPMGRAYIKWKAPTCGCVHIRATVHSDGEYYLEDADVTNGPLARTICPKRKYAHEVTYPRRTEQPGTALKDQTIVSRRDRLRQLCRIVHQDKDTHHEFYTRRNIDTLSYFEKDLLEIALEQRKAAVKVCCEHDDDHQLMDCFGDVRRRRIDEFCGVGDLAVPIAADRVQWVNQRKSECCWQIGEDRYTCFNYTHFEVSMLRDDTIRSETLSRVSLDEFDPANDVEDYSGHTKHSTRPQSPPAWQHAYSDRKVIGDSTNKSKRRHASAKMKKQHYDNDDVDGDPIVPVMKSDDGDGEHAEDNEKTFTDSQSQDIEDPKENITMTKRVCCNNGATVGATSKGIHRCFNMANKAAEYFGALWHRQCDRHFVICCMQIVDSMRSRKRGFTNIDGVAFSFGETPETEVAQTKE